MKVLAYNHTTQSEMLFENIREFELACRWHKLELKDENYESPKVIDEIEVEEITVKKNIDEKDVITYNQVVIHKDELKEYSVSKFRKEIDLFSMEDLETFIKFDERATIVKEAKKELNKRSK